MAKEKIRAADILHAQEKKHANLKHPEPFWGEVKNGSTWYPDPVHGLRKLDGVAIRPSWANPCITGYEIKVERRDFQGDQKWPQYLDLCHELSLVCPPDLIKPEEVMVPGVGLIYYNPESKKLRTVVKALYRPIELPTQMLYYLAICRHTRLQHPFFTDERDQLEAWLEDRPMRRSLGELVGKKLAAKIKDLEERLWLAEQKVGDCERSQQLENEIHDVLHRHGVRTWRGRVVADLEKALARSFPPTLGHAIKRAVAELETAAKIIEAKEAQAAQPDEEADD